MRLFSFQICPFGRCGSGKFSHPACQHREILRNTLKLSDLKILPTAQHALEPPNSDKMTHFLRAKVSQRHEMRGRNFPTLKVGEFPF
jgi:hypothetical protein